MARRTASTVDHTPGPDGATTAPRFNMEFIDSLNKAAETGRKLIEPGVYDVEIVEVTETTSGDGDPQDILRLKITSPGEFEGRTILHYITYNERSAQWAQDALQAFGSDFGLPTDKLVGATARAALANRHVNGNVYTNVARWS